MNNFKWRVWELTKRYFKKRKSVLFGIPPERGNIGSFTPFGFLFGFDSLSRLLCINTIKNLESIPNKFKCEKKMQWLILSNFLAIFSLKKLHCEQFKKLLWLCYFCIRLVYLTVLTKYFAYNLIFLATQFWTLGHTYVTFMIIADVSWIIARILVEAQDQPQIHLLLNLHIDLKVHP